ncbi:MAG: WYL domain-containing protein [Prevotella sp.]|nr:WYL domain-containing protein [Prevotella sp.]
MRHDKLERELYLLELLTENRSYTVSKLCDKVGISRRNLYYYLEFFRDCGFTVYKHGEYYCIDRCSPFFNHIIERVSFTEEEAVLIRRLLSKTGNENALTENLKRKLDRFYDFDILTNDELREQAAHNIGILYQAIKFKQQVLLHGYVSLNSRTTKDRLVEPFMLMNNNNEVRCFEPSSRLNKTFKISRMRDVELLDMGWCYESLHRDLYTDIFMFSGEDRMPVKMILGNVAYNILKEEYPRALKYVTEMPDGKYILDMYVCSYVGIGRFVLGLFEDIEVLENDEFREYLKKKIEKMKVKAP